jgi:hypothetical protein
LKVRVHISVDWCAGTNERTRNRVGYRTEERSSRFLIGAVGGLCMLDDFSRTGERQPLTSLEGRGTDDKRKAQMKTLPLAAAIALVSAGAAFSQGSPAQPTPNPGANQGAQAQPRQSIRQQIQSDLSQAGYTDIKIMPESFLVRANDKRGNPVMMVIDPDSITTVTGENPHSSATTGSAPGTSNLPGNNGAPQPGTGPK